MRLRQCITPLTITLLAACSDDTTIEPICRYLIDPSECGETSDETGGEIVADPEDDPEPEDPPMPDACVLTADGEPRTVVQCNGTLAASISFETIIGSCAKTLGDPDWCRESYEFGVGQDSYEMPMVMACCDPDAAEDEELLQYCAVDLVEQICRSVPMRLQMLIDDGVIKVGKGQAKALRDWLNQHQQDCFNTINIHGEQPGELAATSWLINGGNNKHWPALKNFRVHIDAAQVSSTTVPDDEGERIACDDPSFNNGEIFEEPGPVAPGIRDVTHLGEAASVSIAGPELLGNRVAGYASLDSSSGCVGSRCSTFAAVEDASAGTWALEELSIFAAGDVMLQSGELEVAVSGAALRLYGVSDGGIRSGDGVADTYVIRPGDAHFLISGESSRLRDARWASNSTTITAHKTELGWQLDGFSVSHVDGAGDTWTLTFSPTTWN